MKRFRNQSLAVLAAGVLVSLSVSSVFAAHPENASTDNRGHEVSAFVHALLFGSSEDSDQTDEDTTEEQQLEDQDEQSDEQSDEQQSEESPTSDVTGADHGACVSEAARGGETGGPNDNHGGAVSEAARETCWQAEPTNGEEGADAPTEVSDGPGNSENHGSHGNTGGKKK